MRKTIILIILMLSFISSVYAIINNYPLIKTKSIDYQRTIETEFKLPAGAKVIEFQLLNSRQHKNRALILWMLNPKKNPYSSGDLYTCPDETRGSYYSGPTRLSLVDTDTKQMINTINIVDKDYDEGDTFDIPYKVRKGYYYEVNSKSSKIEAKPNIMVIKDYNGDGEALEFVLFNKISCMSVATALFGYSEKQDKAIQYAIELDINEDKKPAKSMGGWGDNLFNTKPIKSGFWQYELDYRGRGGALEKFEIRYNKERELFQGTCILTTDD